MKHPIHSLCRPGGIPGEPGIPQLIETHISWVLIGERSVYKFKKPVHYSFLDFSTAEKRRYYCEREIMLNRRLTAGIYLDVVPVRQTSEGWTLADGEGAPVDHAVHMRKMDPLRRMDLLAREGRVIGEEIDTLAVRLARFHRRAEIVPDRSGKADAGAMRELFNDLAREKEFLGLGLGPWAATLIEKAISCSDRFLQQITPLLDRRRKAGLCRDGHGDLHCRNIFLVDPPQVFDCIEFNDGLRRIDVLNDIAFLCMDLDSLGHPELAQRLMIRWTQHFPDALGAADRPLLEYYKAYRANIRAKINSLRARSAVSLDEKRIALEAAAGYLRLMDRYWTLVFEGTKQPA
jgi:aminoglycoside phosphotransferase family enzyme